MRLDIFGVIRKHDMPSRFEVTIASRTSSFLAKDPIILTVALARESILPILKQPHYELDGIPGNGHQRNAINVRTRKARIVGESQIAFVFL